MSMISAPWPRARCGTAGASVALWRAVLRRSRQLQRRRRSAGVVGVVLLVAGAFGARALAPDPETDQVAAIPAEMCSREPATSALSPDPSRGRDLPGDNIVPEPGMSTPAERVPPAEVSDLVLLPTDPPHAVSVIDAGGRARAGLVPRDAPQPGQGRG